MKKILTPMAAALMVAGLLLPAAAGAADLEPVARMSAGPTSIDWQPLLASHEGMVLTVSTPGGYVVRREFKAGETPTFSVFDAEGKARRDGSYTYELRALPAVSKEVREKLRAYRETGDRSLLAEVRERLPQGTFVQSGSFAIADGAFMSPTAVETTERTATKGLRNTSGKALRNVTANDQVIPDDLIVQQSLCVGFDCVNNESFGFDTIRLKENNTRIKFEDTSTGTFPSNDWQLTANDSASGGQNKFSIEDITGARVPFTVEAGATTNSVYVDSTGRIGFRTSTPVLDLHVATSNTPAIRLEQNSSGGFTAQTWDIAGNEANFFVRDVTGGSRLPFRIRPGAPTSSIDISADGDIGIGTASPSSKLDIDSGVVTIGGHNIGERSGVVEDLQVNALRNTIYNVDSDNDSTNASFSVSKDGNPNTVIFVAREDNLAGFHRQTPSFPLHVGTDATNGNGAHVTAAGVWTNGSSRTNKENIRSLSAEDAMQALVGLEPVRYTGKSSPDGEEYIGFIAEDVPELVAMNDRKGLASMDVVAVLTKVVQQQEKTIDQLAARIAELEAAREAAAPQP